MFGVIIRKYIGYGFMLVLCNFENIYGRSVCMGVEFLVEFSIWGFVIDN